MHTSTTRELDVVAAKASAPMVALGAEQGIDLLAPDCQQGRLAKLHQRTRRLAERGMSTAEYAVGVLAAVAFALVLLRVFTHADFFKTMLQFVLKIIGQVAGQIK